MSDNNIDDEFKHQLKTIHHHITKSASFTHAMPSIEPLILDLLHAIRITVYQCVRNGKEISATFKSSGDEQEIRVPFSPTSIAGFAALSQRPLLIKNLYDDEELQQIHPKL